MQIFTLMQKEAVRGHAPANLAFAAVLTSSFALLAFSKYRRAQIVPITDSTALLASSSEPLQSFTVLNYCKFLPLLTQALSIFRNALPGPYCKCSEKGVLLCIAQQVRVETEKAK